MKPLKRHLAGLCLSVAACLPGGFAAAAPSPPRVSVEYRPSYPANFLWLVNALAGDPHASSASFQAYWKASGFARPEDETRLAAFRRLRERYSGDYLPSDEGPKTPVPVTPTGGDLRQKFYALFFSSVQMDEVWAKAEILLTPDDREELQAIFAYFRPGFERHWKRCGYLDAYCARFRQFADTVDLPAILGDAARFYGVSAEKDLPVRVVFLFTPDKHHTFGRAIGPNLVVEIPEGDSPESQVDVAVHELCHYFYDRGGLERDTTFMARFFGSGDRRALPAWGLLNEGLATAIGEGVAVERFAPATFTKTLSAPRGWYADDRIDPFAKSLFPAVKEAIRAGETYRELGPAFLAAYASSLSGQDDDPKTYLASYILIDGFSRRKGFARFFEQVPPRSVWHSHFAAGTRMLDAYPAQTVLAAATAAELAAVRADAAAYHVSPEALDALGRHERALLSIRRPLNGYVFLVYGQDAAALDEAMARFGKLSQFREGLMPL